MQVVVRYIPSKNTTFARGWAEYAHMVLGRNLRCNVHWTIRQTVVASQQLVGFDDGEVIAFQNIQFHVFVDLFSGEIFEEVVFIQTQGQVSAEVVVI